MTRRAFANRLTIALFLAMISVPLLGGVAGITNDPTSTMFDAQQKPAWKSRPGAILRYVRDYQRYYNVHFAFREPLIRLHAKLKVGVFGISSAKNVTLGKDGWLFYAGEQIVADFQRLRPFTNEELAQWAKLLTVRKRWLAARGIPSLFYVAPNPQTLYPEQMPDSMWRAAYPSRMDQLIAYLREHSDVDMLDMRPPLLAAKSSERVAYKTDSHWNQLGGFLAYQEISAWMKKSFPQWRMFTLQDFERHDLGAWHGGLCYFLGAPELFSEPRIELRPRRAGAVFSDGLPLPSNEIFDAWFRRNRVVRESPDGEIASAVILRDSQFAAPGQFLSRHFRRSVLLWTSKLEPEVIEAEHPSVVVFAIAERLLMNPVPVDPPLP